MFPSDMQGNRKTIWSGTLEWYEKSNSADQSKILHQADCFVATKEIHSSSIQTENWPTCLQLHFISRPFVIAVGRQFLIESKSVTFHPSACESLESLTKLLSSGYIGYVKLDKCTQSCDNVQVLVLLYSIEKKAYFGYIPNNQAEFRDTLRRVYAEKLSAQLSSNNGDLNQTQQQQHQQPQHQQPHQVSQALQINQCPQQNNQVQQQMVQNQTRHPDVNIDQYLPIIPPMIMMHHEQQQYPEQASNFHPYRIENDTATMFQPNQIVNLQVENNYLKQQMGQMITSLDIFQKENSFMKDLNQKLLDRNEELLNHITILQQQMMQKWTVANGKDEAWKIEPIDQQ